jgi:hypothetical protein
VCKQTDGLFLKCFDEEVARSAHGLVCDDSLADSILTKLVLVLSIDGCVHARVNIEITGSFGI